MSRCLRLLVLTLASLSGLVPQAALGRPQCPNTRTLLSEMRSGVLTFSPNCSAASYVCPDVHPKGAAIALNAVDFGTLGKAACGKCIKITAPKQFAAVLPVSNVLTQGQSGDLDLANHPLPTTERCAQRYEVQWEYDDGPC